MTGLLGTGPRATPLRVAPGAAWGHASSAGRQRKTDRGGAGPWSRNGRLAMPFLVLVASRDSSPEPRDAASPGPSTRRACAFLALPRVLAQAMGMEGRAPGLQCRARGPGRPNGSVKSAKQSRSRVLSGRGRDARHARPKRGADRATLLAGNGFLLTGVGRCRPRAAAPGRAGERGGRRVAGRHPAALLAGVGGGRWRPGAPRAQCPGRSLLQKPGPRRGEMAGVCAGLGLGGRLGRLP
jgi:hypothetical protein